jgi:hypothetical protein
VGAEFTINKRPATWTTNPNSKVFGAPDPVPLTTGSAVAPGVGTGFLPADMVTATYSRIAGGSVSPPTYHITATLSSVPASALNNYIVTNTGNEFTINKADTTTSVTSSANPSIVNQLVTFTATVAVVSPGAGTPSGNVEFYDGMTLLGTGALNGLVPNKATFSISTLSAGNHNITAHYVGDGNFNGSTSSIFAQSVQYIFVGFLPPIDNLPIINSSKAGQTIPIKWQLKDYAGNLINDLGTLAPNGLTSGTVTCGAAAVDVVEELSAPGSTVFRFDGTQFIYNWQTTKSWAGGCRTLQVKLSDGTSHYAQFTFK